MSQHVYKPIKITGSSTHSSDEAVRVAIEKAAASLNHLRWFKVVETRGHIDGGTVAHWQVTLEISFTRD